MDIREPIAKMRAQAQANRERAAALKADAQDYIAEAKARYDHMARQAAAQEEEAAFWEALAVEQEQKASQAPAAQDGGA